MAAVQRWRIGLYGAAGDLLRHGAAVADALHDAGAGRLASWLQSCVVGVAGAVTAERDPGPALHRSEQALHAAARRLGAHPAVLRGLAAVGRVRHWWAVDPVRDSHPPQLRWVAPVTLPPRE